MVGPLGRDDVGVVQRNRLLGVRGELAWVGVGRVGAARRREVDDVGRQAAAGEARVHEQRARQVGRGVDGAGRIAGARASAAAAVVPAGQGHLHPAFQMLAELRLQLAFDIVLVDDVALAGHAGNDVGEVAVALLFPVASEAELQVGRQRAGDRGFQQRAAIVAHRGANFAVGLFGRALGDHVDRAADGVAAVERALRAAEHFDPVDEQRRAAGFNGRGGVDAVRIGSDAGVGGLHVGQAADAAQADAVQLARIGQAGREVGHVLDGVDTQEVALLGGVGRNGDRDVMQALAPLFGGDDQFLDGAPRADGRRCGRGAGLRAGGCSEGDREEHGARRQKANLVIHLNLPSGPRGRDMTTAYFPSHWLRLPEASTSLRQKYNHLSKTRFAQ